MKRKEVTLVTEAQIAALERECFLSQTKLIITTTHTANIYSTATYLAV